jgi:cobalamin synthase
MDFSNHSDSFRKAWNLLSYFKFPDSRGMKKEEIEEIPENIVAYFPLVGGALGFSFYCLAWLLERIMHEKIFSSILSAVIITLVIEVLTLGKDLAALMSFLKSVAKRLPPEETLSIIEEKETVNNGVSELVLLFSLFLLKIICIGILIYSNHASWLIVMLTFPYLIQGLMAICGDSESGGSLLPSDQNTVKTAWITAAAISFLACLKSIPAAALALVFSWLFYDIFRKYWLGKFKGITGKTVGLAGIILEYILMLAGAILLRSEPIAKLL